MNATNNWIKKGIWLVMILLLASSGSLFSAEKEKGQAFLGVTISSLSEEKLKELKIEHGVRVLGVEKGEAAEKAGIVEHDIIQFVGDQKISNPEDLVSKIRAAKPGDQARIKLIRDGKPKEVTATLGERAEASDVFIWKGDKGFAFKPEPSYFLGVQLYELGDDLAGYFNVKKGEGVLILEIDEKSPAEKAGLKPGDVIVKVNGIAVKDSGAVRKALAETKEGKAEIAIVRHGKAMTLSAEPEKRHGWGYIFDEGFPALGRLYMPHMRIADRALGHLEILTEPDREKIRIKISEKMKEVEEKYKEAAEKMKLEGEKAREKLEALKKKIATIVRI